MSIPIVVAAGDLFATIPGIFGFHPDNSVIFMCFDHVEESRFELGPALRIGIEALVDLDEAVTYIADHSLVMVLVVSDDPIKVEEATNALEPLRTNGALNHLAGCWATRRIATGEPFHMTLGPGEGAEEWESGLIGSVTDSPTATHSLIHGHQISESREEALALFARDFTPLGEARAQELTARALQRADTFERTAVGYAQFTEELRKFTHDVTAMDRTSNSFIYDEEALEVGLTAVANTDVRDYMLSHLLDTPHVTMELMLAAARASTDDHMRSNALCVYSLAALMSGSSAQAHHALHAGATEDPSHTFTCLLLNAMQEGHHDALLDAVRAGSLMVQSDLG